MSEQFHNPYQFIPVDTRKAKGKTAYPDAKALSASTNHYVRHDYWNQESVSGRIICTLEAISPVVVGMEQIQGDKKAGTTGTVTPYCDRDGNPAIPGNSLRGMIGSIAETISQSSLRVLVPAARGEYSVRKPAQADNLGKEFAALKQIGVLCKTEQGYQVYPLAHEGFAVGDYLDDKKYTKCCESKQKRNPNIECPSADRKRKKGEVGLISGNGVKCYQHLRHKKLEQYGDHEQGVYYIRGQFDPLCKRSERYIPWDGEIEQDKLLTIKPGVIETLETILRTVAATEKDQAKQEAMRKTMLPVGYAGHKERVWVVDPRKPALQPLVLDGDLLYYRTEGAEVVELSYSSIWRKAIDGDLHSAFRERAGADSLPWNNDRDSLTPVEALFGVVEDEPNEKQRGGARNLASRVHFTDALAIRQVDLMASVVLKILNSPKPPSPALYFSGNGRYVAKTELDLNQHTPNGRKQYLPHPRSIGDNPHNDWETRQKAGDEEYRPHMHLSCEPIPTGATFEFSIHFENLSWPELGLLLTALQPDQANGTFVHRLGLGKPLGLGHVRLASQVEMIGRANRYSLQGLRQNRYQEWTGKVDLGLVDDTALAQLCLLGNPANIKHSVCYPFDSRSGQLAYGESRSFKWFGENDRTAKGARHQAMPTPKTAKPLPILES